MSANKPGWAKTVVFMGLVAMPYMAYAGEWFPCGNLGQLSNCQLPAYPGTRYEYGMAYNTSQPIPVVCSSWNVGSRLYNKDPYFVYSDNPSSTMQWGGAMFYTGTYAADDDACQSGTWRHRYWSLGANNVISTAASNGCINQQLYCRLR